MFKAAKFMFDIQNYMFEAAILSANV